MAVPHRATGANAGSSSVLNSPTQKPRASTSVPSSPAHARKLEEYGDTLQMYDSPRHSHESATSLLHGQHSRSSSAGSFDSFVGGGLERSSLQQVPGLSRLAEEDSDGLTYNHSGQYDDDEFPGKYDRRSSLYSKIDSDALPGGSTSSKRRQRRHRQREGSIVPPIVQESASKAATMIKENMGLLLIAAAMACFAGMNAMVKIMTSSEVAVPVWELIWTRMSITWLFCYLYMRIKGVEDPLLGPKGVRGWLVLRGFVGFFGLFGSYFALQYLSLSDATVLAFLTPTVTAILGAVFLKEPYTIKEAISGLISFGGAILVAQPSFLFGSLAEEEDPEERLLAVGVALIGVVAASGAYVTIRKIGKKAHALHSVTYFCMGCVITSTCIPIFVKGETLVLPYKPVFWVYLTGIGICGFLAQFLMARALQIERVGRALLGNYTQLPWALLLQYLIFGEVMDFLSTMGAIIIMGSTCWVVLTREKEPAEAKTHKARALSLSSSAGGGDFAQGDFDSDEEAPREVPAGGSGESPYTVLTDNEADGLEAGLLPSGTAEVVKATGSEVPSGTVTPANHVK